MRTQRLRINQVLSVITFTTLSYHAIAASHVTVYFEKSTPVETHLFNYYEKLFE